MTEAFDLDWLDLREPFDALARNEALAARLLARLPAREIRFVRAGLAFFKYHLYAGADRRELARPFLDQFLAVVPAQATGH